MAFLTNFRTRSNDIKDPKYISRGLIVMEWVKLGDPDCDSKFSSKEEYINFIETMHTKAFNAHFGNIFTQEFFYFRHEHRTDQTKAMDDVVELERKKVYGNSNGSLNNWYKVLIGN